MLQLARMYLTVDDLDACQQQCVQLLKMDSENDDATVVGWDDLKTFFLSLHRYSWFYIRIGYNLLNRFYFFKETAHCYCKLILNCSKRKVKFHFFSNKWEDLSEQMCW